MAEVEEGTGAEKDGSGEAVVAAWNGFGTVVVLVSGSLNRSGCTVDLQGRKKSDYSPRMIAAHPPP